MVEGTYFYVGLLAAAAAIDAGHPGPFIAGAYVVALVPVLPWAARQSVRVGRRAWLARPRDIGALLHTPLPGSWTWPEDAAPAYRSS